MGAQTSGANRFIQFEPVPALAMTVIFGETIGRTLGW
jgi:hypothetical protein